MVRGFLDFIREQGVIGLAVGFILGGAVSTVVSGLVGDIVNPLLGVALGKGQALSNTSINIASAQVKYGDFINTVINFVIIALVVYLSVKILGVDKWDKKKESK